MISAIHQPHDKFFKLSLGEYPVAKEFFTEHLPASILKKTDLSTLKLEKESFVDENFKGSEADIVYSVTIKNKKSYIYILCEHQSTIDQWIAFRLWGYLIRLLEAHLKQHPDEPLPFVYPMVVYTGQEAWNAPLDIFPLFGDQQSLAQEWFLKPFQLLNIHKIPDDEMRQRQWCGIVEFALKYKKVRDFRKFLETLLPWLQELDKKNSSSGFSLVTIVVKYILDGLEAKGFKEFAEQVQKHLSVKLGGKIMTLAQELKEQGINIGKLELIINQLKRRFKEIPKTYLALLERADSKTLSIWSERILDAKTLEEVFETVG